MKSRKWSFLLEDYGKLSEYVRSYECFWEDACLLAYLSLSSEVLYEYDEIPSSPGTPLLLSKTIILTLHMSSPTTPPLL